MGGSFALGLLCIPLFARETPALPKFNIASSPINRDARNGSTYAPVIKRVAPSVVNISSTRTIRVRPNPMSENPLFHRFFGGGR